MNKLLEKGTDKQIWQTITQDPYYHDFIEETKLAYERYCQTDIEPLKYSEFILFYKTGSRREYETKYFARRSRLAALAILCLLYDEQKYIAELEDTIWAICDEYTWALPAHIDLKCNEAYSIDLFAAETGFSLSEILYLLEDKVSPFIKERIRFEVNRRIIEVFQNRIFHWETIPNNWSAVCAGSVGAAFMYMAPTLFPQIKDRIDGAMECFLSSYEEDGACKEGLSYWAYGFGFFVYYAQLLKEFTNSKYDYFKNEKVRAIAAYQQKVFLRADVVASFSDSEIKGAYHIGLLHFLKDEYPDDIEVLSYQYRQNYCTGNIRFSWLAYVRTFLWTDKTLHETQSSSEKLYYMPKSHVYINRKHAYSFAAKGGDNDEPHNHNDIGTFILATGDNQKLFDIGAGEYNRDYFAEETRYGFLCNSSFGHSVPIIDQCGQCAGKTYFGNIIAANESNLRIDITNAYNHASLVKLERQFYFKEKSCSLIDEYELSDCNIPVTERFVTMIEPRINGGIIHIADIGIRYDEQVCKPHVQKTKFVNHHDHETDVYFVDFEIMSMTNKYQVKFEFFI